MKSRCDFITPATVEEMNSTAFRFGANANKKNLFALHDQPENPGGLAEVLCNWMQDAPADNLRLFYGGDFPTLNSMLCVFTAAACNPNKHIYMRTGNHDYAVTLETEYEQPDNIRLYLETQTYMCLNLTQYPTLIYNKGKQYIEDLDFFPDFNKPQQKEEVTVQLTEDCNTAFATRKPVWLQMNEKKNE